MSKYKIAPIVFLFCAGSGFASSPLHRAIDKGNPAKAIKIVEDSVGKKSFFKKEFDLNEKDKNGHAPLIRAASLGYHDLALLLIQKGAELETTDFYGNTSLLRAINNSDPEMVALLIQSGAKLDAEDLGGRSVIQHAIASKNQVIFRKVTDLADPDYRDRDQNSLLHFAAASGNAEIIHQLLERGLDLESVNRLKRTPLMVAVLNKNLETALTLYQAGASLYPRDLSGNSVGELAHSAKFSKLLNELIRHWDSGPLPEQEIFFFLEYNPDILNPGWTLLASQVPAVIQDIKKSETAWRLKQMKKKLLINSAALGELTSRIQELRHRELEDLADRFDVERDLEKDLKKAAVTSHTEILESPSACSICLMDFKDCLGPGFGPADCDCQFHPECGSAIANNAMGNAGIEIPLCPLGCGGRITLDFLRRAGLSESEISAFSDRQLTLRLAFSPEWKFCPTSDCINGKILSKKESSHFYCCLCEKPQCLKCAENHPGDCAIYNLSRQEMQSLLQSGARPAGRFRPCYYCGVITEKAGGCNHMTCLNPACRKDWDWNNGLYRGTPTHSAGRMNYQPLQEPHL
ncbi:MAG: ankyrin repeat domain-containing protein [Bdellovibrionia bacterium]